MTTTTSTTTQPGRPDRSGGLARRLVDDTNPCHPAGVARVEEVIAGLMSPTYRLMSLLTYTACLRPAELASLHAHQLHLHIGGRAGQVLVTGRTDPSHNRVVPLDPATVVMADRWLDLIDPNAVLPLFPATWHAGWRTALATATRGAGRVLTPETVRRAGITHLWDSEPAGRYPTVVARIVGVTLEDLLVAYPPPVGTDAGDEGVAA